MSCARHASMCHGEVMSPDADLIGSVEAGRILGKSPRTVHRLVAAGELTPVHTAPGGANGSFLFRRSDVEALVGLTEVSA